MPGQAPEALVNLAIRPLDIGQTPAGGSAPAPMPPALKELAGTGEAGRLLLTPVFSMHALGATHREAISRQQWRVPHSAVREGKLLMHSKTLLCNVTQVMFVKVCTAGDSAISAIRSNPSVSNLLQQGCPPYESWPWRLQVHAAVTASQCTI